MSAQNAEVNQFHAGTSLNRLGIDESNVRHLKALFVLRAVERNREYGDDIATVSRVSPDLAFQMLREQINSDARALEHFARAEKSLKELASQIDAGGYVELEMRQERFLDGQYDKALEVLRRPATDAAGLKMRKIEPRTWRC
jgi:hypothetical protein